MRHRALLLAASVLAACTKPAAMPAQPPAAPAERGVDTAAMDRTVAPGADFYAYANGTWVRTAEIPADRSYTGSIMKVVQEVENRTRAILEEAARNPAPAGSELRKIGDYYASFMDEATIESKGLAPLQPELDRIDAIGDQRALATELGASLRADVDALNATDLYTGHVLGFWVEQDLDDPSRTAPYLLQGGLGMPDRSYYLDDSPKLAELRPRYQAHLATVLALAHVADPEARAARIMALETRLAKTHGTREDSADVRKSDNHWTRADFDRRAPGLDWAAFFAAAGLADQPSFIVWQPSAVTGLAALVKSEPLATWKEYLTLRAIEHAAPFLPKAFADESFAFYGKALSGTTKQLDRWKRGVAATNAALGEAVGKVYVARHFPPEAKRELTVMVDNIVAAFGRRIDALEWMAPETKAKAKEKLAALKVGIAYPDQWRDFSGLEVVRGDALGNRERAELFAYRQEVAKLGKPADRGEWAMLPQTVNAVNLPVRNTLNFPAGFLEPPLYDRGTTAAVKYGAIGAVIGHEISHSFDDQGAQFDAHGKLSNWWTAADLAHFRQAAERLVYQYDAYRPLPDLAVNGKLTLSENIADIAGLAVAHDAWKASLGSSPAPVVDGLTGEQQFFVSFAQTWQTKRREEAMRAALLTDGHAPGQYRALTVRNLDGWYTAFGIEPGQQLYLAPSDRARIW